MKTSHSTTSVDRGLVFLVLLLLFSGCQTPALEPVGFQGSTMGTTYRVTYAGADSDTVADQQAVEALLVDINASLSTYIQSSIISGINASQDTTRWHEIDTHFETVFDRSKELYTLTGGAFNPAVGPLVQAWGFGPEGINRTPTDATIDSLLTLVNFDDFIKHPTERSIRKRVPGASLDFNAIAKGYGVDVVAGYFESIGVTDYFVEIGGEVRTGGQHPSGRGWRVGIETPADNQLAGQATQEIVELGDEAMATSGNYRNFYERDGLRYVHTVDPKTGYTRTSSLLSASVLTTDCMTADALATAFMVMGPDSAMAFVEQHEELEAFLIVGIENGEYSEVPSSGFPGATTN